MALAVPSKPMKLGLQPLPVVSSVVPTMSDTAFVGSNGAEMIAWIKEVVKTEGVGVIIFHGVGDDYLSVSDEEHQKLLDYLAAHRTEIWTVQRSNGLRG